MFGERGKIGKVLLDAKGNIVFAKNNVETAIREIESGDIEGAKGTLSNTVINNLDVAYRDILQLEQLNNKIKEILEKEEQLLTRITRALEVELGK